MSSQESQPIRRFLATRGLFVLSVAVCAFLFFQLAVLVGKSSETDKTVELLRVERARLSEEYTQRERIRALLESDYFAEREARTKFGYKKSGERAIIITEKISAPNEQYGRTQKKADDKTALARNADQRAEGDEIIEAYTKRWWRFFFGR